MAVFMENRKGRILELARVLKKNEVDLITLSIADTKDFGFLRCIARDNDKAMRVLKEAGFTVTASELLGVEVNDRPGGLADVLTLLDESGINVEYLYSFAHIQSKRAIILLKVSDEALALSVLKKNGIKLIDNGVI
jgi:hypothetical protein